MIHSTDTIIALSTPPGIGAIGIIRISGDQAISISDQVFSKDLLKAEGYSLHYGSILKGEEVLDEVVLSVFKKPRSFTKEDVVEISCHGSTYILQEVIQLLIEKGARPALAGEFTQRAYLNGAMDLAQAEAVADLIASSSAASHKMALRQMRGGISNELQALRVELLNFTSLIELELDFSEEDVQFADRQQLDDLVERIRQKLESLISSFRLGNAIKQGVPTVIMGKPNAGKSTLLNTLLNENRAIVSDIPGTTRDVIEDRIIIEGIEFRLMDTAGVRETQDVIEAEGVRRTLSLAEQANLLIYIYDLSTDSIPDAEAYLSGLNLAEGSQIMILANKEDLLDTQPDLSTSSYPTLMFSAKEKTQIDQLKQMMLTAVQNFSTVSPDQTLISNSRHLHALQQALTAIQDVQAGLLNGLTGDLLSIDIRTVLHHIGEITGEITNDEVLGNIFSKFCIGK
ncbi:MAG: tRNA uridine-5-carboxymethylaminomethyl(34) synthesis GTPase MnmE [Bacteroidota bacterium]